MGQLVDEPNAKIEEAAKPAIDLAPPPGQNSCSEIQRLFMAAIASNPKLRRELVRAARDPVLAPPIEVGIDKLRLLKFCYLVNDQLATWPFLRAMGAAVTGLAAIIAFSYDLLSGLGFFSFSLITWMVICAILGAIERIRRLSLLKSVSLSYFNAEIINKRIDEVRVAEESLRCIGPPNQNIVVHRGFDPFDFAGIPYGGWSFIIDASPSDQADYPEQFSIEAVENEIAEALITHYGDKISIRELLAVSGIYADVLQKTPPPPPDPIQLLSSYKDFGWPRREFAIPNEEIRRLAREHPRTTRRYIWFAVNGWEGQLALSHFIRLTQDGQMLYVEYKRYVLGPAHESCHVADLTSFDKDDNGPEILKGIGTGILYLFSHSSIAGDSGWEARDRALHDYEETKKFAQFFNHGAMRSLRSMLTSGSFISFSQKSDLDMWVKTFDKIVLTVIADYLEECGIDTSEFREKEHAIYNSGILVQGGDVSAQALAVGEGAVAKNSTTGSIYETKKEKRARNAG